MFKIMKVEIAYTKEIDGHSYETDMPVASNYQPRIQYLSKIDRDYWWHPERGQALTFGTMLEASAVVAAYRQHQGDRHSRIQIVED